MGSACLRRRWEGLERGIWTHPSQGSRIKPRPVGDLDEDEQSSWRESERESVCVYVQLFVTLASGTPGCLMSSKEKKKNYCCYNLSEIWHIIILQALCFCPKCPVANYFFFFFVAKAEVLKEKKKKSFEKLHVKCNIWTHISLFNMFIYGNTL